jgi:hypothetical protein
MNGMISVEWDFFFSEQEKQGFNALKGHQGKPRWPKVTRSQWAGCADVSEPSYVVAN